MAGNNSPILAKSGAGGGLSLLEHTRHVAAAAKAIACATGLNPNVAFFGAVLHDLGKAHPKFQALLRGEQESIYRHKTEMPLRHEIASILYLPLFNNEQWQPLIEMVIAHHRSAKAVTQTERGNGIIDLIEEFGEDGVFNFHAGDWVNWHGNVFPILSEFSIQATPITIEQAKSAFDYTVTFVEEAPCGWSKWRGLLNAADYFASALTHNTPERLERAFKLPDLAFFTSSARGSSLYPLSTLQPPKPYRHTLVTAPTGSGKTDFLIKRCTGRVFYTLPFQASINAMYRRITTACPNDDVRVLHAASKITVSKDGYTEKVMQALTGAAVKVLTPYQIAAIALGTKGFEAISVDLQGNDVILDELHSYGENGMALLTEVIKALLLLGCRLHIGSATLPTALKNNVLALLGAECTWQVTLPPEVLNSFNRHRVVKQQEEGLGNVLAEAFANHERVLLVYNRVAEAQRVFAELRQQFPEIPGMLLHSRFKRKDRARLEQLVQEYNQMQGPCYVCSTQVVEVSLDISFDRLITQAAPLDCLIQRFGRINRVRNGGLGNLSPVYLLPPPATKRDARPYNLNAVAASYSVLPEGALQETEVQGMIDAVFPEVSFGTLTQNSMIKETGFGLPLLRNLPKSVLIDALEIDSAACVTESDAATYLAAPAEERAWLEIPVPFAMAHSATFPGTKQRIEAGVWPFIIPDESYSPTEGLLSPVSDNML